MIDDAGAEAWRDEQRATYSSGDPEILARRQQPLAARLVEAAGIQPGERVVDIGAGTGNVAIEAARRGAVVTAVDLTPRQVETGRARCAREGVAVDWQVADAEDLPLPDGSVDVVLSGFGIVYAARPDRAAAEVSRVLRPAGRLLFTAYPRDSFNGRALEVVNRYLAEAPTPVAVDEYLWSEPGALADWLPGRPVELDPQVLETAAYRDADAWFDDVLEVPIVARLHQTLTPQRFADLRSEIVALRTHYARVEADGTLHPQEGYVVVRVG
ncbi:methyltransferase domain-containing protein [Nocardioides albidus]|uniref:Methyltransferase domain-containing protein n=1 Tax=Nocardioides albidus TaxID=1517589 RepID=A0A5C4WJI8_9ACTN|nr:methyltransferase domain-containing protein [Nocardioides albidus]TNM48213.1 methyltransferase domain-containing protein [Nocardioides albidus]